MTFMRDKEETTLGKFWLISCIVCRGSEAWTILCAVWCPKSANELSHETKNFQVTKILNKFFKNNQWENYNKITFKFPNIKCIRYRRRQQIIPKSHYLRSQLRFTFLHRKIICLSKSTWHVLSFYLFEMVEKNLCDFEEDNQNFREYKSSNFLAKIFSSRILQSDTCNLVIKV